MKRVKQVRKTKPEELNVKKEKFITNNSFVNINPLNSAQADLLEAFKYSSCVVAHGSAGTGKTLLACWHAAKKLYFKDIKKIVLIRAYQPLAGRSIGFLPGELQDKLLPYYRQMIDYLEDYLGKNAVEIHLKNQTIEICSLETIRGRSWDNSIIIVDESQSLYIPEVQALVTRVGTNSQIIFCGDDSGIQTDVRSTMNGLDYLKEIVRKYYIDDVSFVKFCTEDIVRSGLTKAFTLAFEEEMLCNEPIISNDKIKQQLR